VIEVRLFGKLRRFAGDTGVGGDSLLRMPQKQGDAVSDVLERAGIPRPEVGNVFVNGRLAELTRSVADGDRIGVFPRDMSLLYI